MTGKYVERLPSGGELRVERDRWEIGYYFSGPDARHKGTFVNIDGKSVTSYAFAFEENFKEF